MKTVVCFLWMILLWGCSHSGTNSFNGDLNSDLQVGIGQAVQINGENFTIRFHRVVEDSRCPEGAVCVWAGNAAVGLQLGGSGAVEDSLILNTLLEPKSERFHGYRVELKDLLPHPKVNVEADPDDYVAVLRVGRD